jgi:PKD repeat protein
MSYSKVLMTLMACAAASSAHSMSLVDTKGPTIPETPQYRESVVLYQLNPNATPSELKQFNALINPSTLMDLQQIPDIVSIAKVRKIKGFEKAFSEQLEATGAVLFAEPDLALSHALTPQDSSYYNSQWHHQTINSEQAWDHITTVDRTEVTVCVLDTGVDTDHIELAPNLLLPGYNAMLQLEGNVEDVHGHGTGTAGVIGAVGNNQLGITGVAWDIGILPIQINISDQDSRAYISTMAVGIRYCADQGGKVANLSYGGADSATIDSAANYLRNAGGLLFMSAGNDGNDYTTTTYPDYSSFVVVGATDQNDQRASFSQAGPYVDMTAPGVSILTTIPDNYITYYSGTSFSSPMVAGVAALVYGLNPNFTPSEVEGYLYTTAGDIGAIGDDDVFGHGLLNAGSAVQAAYEDLNTVTENTAPIAIASANLLSGFAPLQINFTALESYDPDGEIISYQWNFDDGLGTGETATHTYNNPGTYNVTLTVTDNRYTQTVSEPIVIDVQNDSSIAQAPTNLLGMADGSSAVLSWEHNSVGSTTFEIHQGVKKRGKTTFTLHDSVYGVSTYIDENLEVGNYIYKVRAQSALGATDFTNQVQVTIESTGSSEPLPSIGTPTLYGSVDQSSGLVSLNWTDTCSGLANCSFNLERGDTKNKGAINFLSIANGTGLDYVVLEENSGTYYYRVITVVDGEQGPESNTVSVRVR